MRFLSLLAVLLLASCATEAEYARDNATWTPNYPPVFLYVDDAHAACAAIGTRFGSGQTINGCSDPWGRVRPNSCTVILPNNPPAWLVEHEVLHCRYGRFH